MLLLAGSILLILSISALAWFLGGEPERFGAALLTGLSIGEILVRSVVGATFTHVDPVSIAVDLIGFLGFGAIALYSWRYWPLWASSLQLLALAAHLVRGLHIHIDPIVYALMRWSPTYIGTLALLVGTINVWRLKRTGGNVRHWRSWSAPSNLKVPTNL